MVEIKWGISQPKHGDVKEMLAVMIRDEKRDLIKMKMLCVYFSCVFVDEIDGDVLDILIVMLTGLLSVILSLFVPGNS